MSGICGICEPGRQVGRADIEAMLASLLLTGESGCESLPGSGIGLGLAQRWPFQQILATSAIRIAVDAELLNRDELMGLLRDAPRDPSTLSIAELIARLYRERGTACVELLRGAFALALWDEIEQRLLLAVDRLGVNTLYWCEERGRLLFASRVGAVRASASAPTRVDPTALIQYLLFSVIPSPLTIYEKISRLRPGFLLVLENGRVRETRYWDMDYAESLSSDENNWAREVREGMRSAVHLHLRECDPEKTGAYLSGGTDSSSVVAFMNERHSPVNTFSIFFEEQRYSEIGYARKTASHFRTRHHELCVRPQDAWEAIPKIIRYYDEPFANSSAIGTYLCASLACERGMDTLLAGDGGDELFAGNERYATDKYFALYRKIPLWVRREVVEPLARILPQDESWLSLPRRYVRRANIPNPRRIFSYHPLLSVPAEEVFSPDLLAEVPPQTWMHLVDSHFHAARANSELNRLMYLDVKLILADNDLRKVLGTAELAGVRARFPLLDHRLAELSGRIPTALKMKGFKKRYIFKRAMKDILPPAVLQKKKHGFGVPLALWFLQDARFEELARDVLTDPRTRQRNYFRPQFYDKVMELHRSQDAKNYGEIIWYLLALELWHREHLEVPQRSVHVG